MLTFHVGTVSSAKTAHCLIMHYTHQKKYPVWLIKPGLDTRTEEVWSRASLKATPNVVLHPEDHLPKLPSDIRMAFVDEAQFLTPEQAKQLFQISLRIPVHAFGLRTDYRGELWPASQVLMAYASHIQMMDTVCHRCDRDAVFNGRIDDKGKIIRHGSGTPIMGCEETFIPLCGSCWIAEDDEEEEEEEKK
jgi:thymidine kinase